MGEKDGPRDMLVAVNGVSAQEGADIVFFSVASSDGDGKVELLAQFLPFGQCAGRVYLAVIILLIGDNDHISILVRHAITTHQQ